MGQTLRFTAFNSILALTLVVSLNGCVSASFNIPNNRFMTPENNGSSFSSKAAVGYGSKSEVTLADSSDFSQAKIDAPVARDSDGVFALAELSLVPMVDVFYGPTGLGAKVQVWGDATEKAKAGNFSVALAVAGEQATNKENVTANSSSGTSSYKVEGAAKYQYLDAMVLMGYRASPNNLYYVNLATNTIKAKGLMTQTGSENGLTTTSSLATPSYDGRETSVLLGLQRSYDTLFWILEPGFSNVKISSDEYAVARSRFSFGGTLGFKF